MKCRVCRTETNHAFSAKILNKYVIQYYECGRCGYLQSEAPYWLSEAYSSAITPADTGILQRNLVLSRVSAAVILGMFDKTKTFLDFAGGYGVFVRLMRDMGFDFYWRDKYAENVIARGFEYSSIDESGKCELLTSMETFEHFEYPLDEIEQMIKLTDNILFSTTLLPQPTPTPDAWWYYSLEHGQHIGFYQHKSLVWIAKHLEMHVCSNRKNFHLLSKKPKSELTFRSLIPFGFLAGGLAAKLTMKSKIQEDFEMAIARATFASQNRDV